jgi:hypothetical protein
LALTVIRYAAQNSVAIGVTADITGLEGAGGSIENDPNVWSGRAVQEVLSILAMRSCINVSGLLIGALLPAIMDISARAT